MEQRVRVGVVEDRRVLTEPVDLLVDGSDAVLRSLDKLGEFGERAGGAGVVAGQGRAPLQVTAGLVICLRRRVVPLAGQLGGA